MRARSSHLRLSSLVILTSVAALASAKPSWASSEDDPPNLEFERRISRIFQNAEPVSNRQWTELIGSRREDLYIIQAGDTLWDISKTLFGDGFFWSKLWAENRALENPHLVSKGKGIRFVEGNEAAAPEIDVVPAKTVETIQLNIVREQQGVAPMYREQALKELTPEQLADQKEVEVDELVAQPELPPAKATKPILRDLPPSFVVKKRNKSTKYDVSGLDTGQVASLTVPARITPNSYLSEGAPKGVGVIHEVELGIDVASIGQNVFIRLSRPARVGEKFSVIHPRGMIKDPVRGEVGPVVEVGGTIEVTDVVDSAKNDYRAVVLTNVNPILRGSLVTEEMFKKTDFARRGTRLNLEARIIGGEFDESRRLIGEHSVVYLDGGARSGLSVGDILPIQASRTERRPDSTLTKWRRAIGLLKLVRVEQTVSTAVVLEAQEEIIPGDMTGGTLPQLARPILPERD